MSKIKVVWICHLSNVKLRKRLDFAPGYLLNRLRVRMNYPMAGVSDFAVWNTKAIKEMSNYSDISLTVILPYYGLKTKLQRFEMEGVNYICFRSQDDHLWPFIKGKVFKKYEQHYWKNRKIIKKEIERIQPDIVHTMGAENLWYSTAVLDVPQNIPSIVSLQTLLSHTDFSSSNYLEGAGVIRCSMEQKIIKKCDYVGTTVDKYREYILQNIDEKKKFLPFTLAVGLDADRAPCEKTYDFVYFAANIHKACDLAIEAFALLCKKYPKVTLNVSGGYDKAYKQQLDDRIAELGITKNVIFTGSKATHEDVLKQIRHSRFALLPLKVDVISGTIREAMANGLPVATTITSGTPSLNEKRESVLLSEIGNHQALADNMEKLLMDEAFAQKIRENAFNTVSERYSNQRFISIWHDHYLQLLKQHIVQ